MALFKTLFFTSMIKLVSLLVLLPSMTYALYNQDLKFENVGTDYISETQSNVFELTEYFAKKPPQIIFLRPATIQNCTIDKISCDPHFPVHLSLDKGNHEARIFNLKYESQGTIKSLTFKVLGSNFPSYTVKGKSSIEDLIVLSPYQFDFKTLQAPKAQGALLVLFPDGSIYFYRETKNLVGDFRPHFINQNLYYSYVDLRRGHMALTVEGPRVFLDKNFQHVKVTDEVFDFHDSVVLDLNHFWRINFEKTRSPLGNCLITPTITETQKGKIKYRLDATTLLKQGLIHPDPLLSQYIFEGELCTELFHMNSLQIVDRHRLLLGFLHSIVMYNRTDKKVEWVFGGSDSVFPMLPGLKNAVFHTSYWNQKTNTLLYFRNQSSDSIGSEANTVVLDIMKKKIVQLKSIGFNSKASSAQGSVTQDAENVFSVFQGVKSSLEGNDFLEIANGQEVFSLQVLPPYGQGYRAYRVPVSTPPTSKDNK